MHMHLDVRACVCRARRSAAVYVQQGGCMCVWPACKGTSGMEPSTGIFVLRVFSGHSLVGTYVVYVRVVSVYATHHSCAPKCVDMRVACVKGHISRCSPMGAFMRVTHV